MFKPMMLAAAMLLPAVLPAWADTAPASPEAPAMPGDPATSPALPGSPQAPSDPAKGQSAPGDASGALDLRPLQEQQQQQQQQQQGTGKPGSGTSVEPGKAPQKQP
ncbi:hypothetical protein [Pseudomonas sp. NPDC007930]|uniref:hypothetical protein n=1 Tax=Pseudomonas sp. NPDC007930 TaxID=3364417 RepID=UPI0036DFE926